MKRDSFRVKTQCENVPHPQGTLPRRYVVVVTGPCDDEVLVDFIVLYRADGNCTWVMLDENGVPQRHGQYYGKLPDIICAMRRCASSQYRYLCSKAAEYDRAGDEEAYRQATHDVYAGMW